MQNMKLWRSRTLVLNCLWAFHQWRRRGGYLIIRRAELATGLFPHFGWMPKHCKHFYHYRPLDRDLRWPLPAAGYIQRGEDRAYPHQGQ